MDPVTSSPTVNVRQVNNHHSGTPPGQSAAPVDGDIDAITLFSLAAPRGSTSAVLHVAFWPPLGSFAPWFFS